MRTGRDGTQLQGRVMRLGVAAVLAVVAFLSAGLALGAASFSDPSGDNNEAPDVVSVTVADSTAGTLTVTVAVANHQVLPPSSWFNLWFDLDSNPSTGDQGDEALVRYFADGTLEFFRWNGVDLVARPSDGMTASYAGGVLTFVGPRVAFDDATGFGILAVASRGQQVEDNEYTAADFAPDTGRSAYAGPGPVAFADPRGDHPAAPDVTSVQVSDAKSGMIAFRITTSNFPTLPRDALILLLVDRDGRRTTGAGGADILLLYQAGELLLGRWDQKQQDFLADDPPTRVSARNSDGVLTLLVHRSELGDAPRFGFAVGAGHLGNDDLFDALDVAPEALFWKYTLVNRPTLRLLAGKAVGAPVRPIAGKAFSVAVPVTRSDTGRPIASGSVKCTVRVGGKTIAATGRVSSGKGTCAFRIPQTASGKQVVGSLVVRSGGKTITARFAFTVR